MYRILISIGFVVSLTTACRSTAPVESIHNSDLVIDAASDTDLAAKKNDSEIALASYQDDTNDSIQPAADSEGLIQGTIEQLVQIGLSNNPKVQAAAYRVEALRNRVPQELALPDPMLNTTTHLAPVQTAAGEQVFALGASQKFVDRDRRAIKASIVCEEISAAEANLKSMQLELAERIRNAGWQLLLARKSIEITEQDKKSLQQISEIAIRQYEVNQAVSQQDVLNIQVELSKVENQLTDLQQNDRSMQARLAGLLSVQPQSQIIVHDQLQVIGLNKLDTDALIDQALSSRPELQTALAEIRRDTKKIELACLQHKPDYNVGLNWIATSSSGISPVANGDDAVMLNVGFNLPIRKSRIQAAVCEAQAVRLASEQRLSGLQDQVSEQVIDIVSKLQSTRKTLELLQADIIPKANRTLELSLDQYATGDLQYVQLIENWRNVLRYRITEANLVAQHNQLLAALVKAVGWFEPSSEFVGNGVNSSADTGSIIAPAYED